MDLLGHGLHHRLSQAVARLVAAAEDPAGRERHDAADQHGDDDDLDQAEACLRGRARGAGDGTVALHGVIPLQLSCLSFRATPSPLRERLQPRALRSEEHTSELQSLMRISYAVFCLKKKNKYCYTHQ